MEIKVNIVFCRLNNSQDMFHIHLLIVEWQYIILNRSFHSLTLTSVFITQDVFSEGLEQWDTVYSGLPDMTAVEHGKTFFMETLQAVMFKRIVKRHFDS